MPERLDMFMARANATYYATRDPFADFITAPEITQAFGEVLGLWAAVCWESLGNPRPVCLIEAGPGRGTLMVDALRAIRQAAPAFSAALQVHLVESSDRLRAIQRARLADATWHSRIEDVPDAPFVLLANEFLDALPIRQFVRDIGGWAERYVEADGPTETRVRCGDVPRAWRNDPPGTVRESGSAAQGFVEQIATRCRRTGGFGLFIDYGSEVSQPGDSLQSLADGKPADPFAQAGSRDITAHVDFAALADVARSTGAAVHGPVPQGVFLARLGLPQRLNALARTLPINAATALMANTRRLTEPDRMGRLFKAMAVSQGRVASCPGFES